VKPRRAKDKVVIITGCNSPLGMGRATAHQYARNGARAVYICDYQDSHLALHVEELHSLYPDVAVHARKFDAGDEEGVEGVVGDAMGRYGRLDVFFANAATSGTWKVCTEMEVQEFERTLRVNLIRYVKLLFRCLSFFPSCLAFTCDIG
jgi:NAD(P)-dependent dehydrogenase (short-subunit alcohol dehydrogenase family)